MNARLRQTVYALGVLATIAVALTAATTTALSLREQRANVAELSDRAVALQARERQLKPAPGRDPSASPFFVANTITVAGAALQQRLEAAVAAARGTLVSSKVEVAPTGNEHRIALAAELSISEFDMQALLFDLETGRPYLFVEAVEARSQEGASEHGALSVSLNLSGQWSEAK
jgi:general secretion pathway protein M